MKTDVLKYLRGLYSTLMFPSHVPETNMPLQHKLDPRAIIKRSFDATEASNW